MGFEIQKLLEEESKSAKCMIYSVVKHEVSLDKAIRTMSNFVKNNPTYTYRLVEGYFDDVHSGDRRQPDGNKP